MVMLGSMYGFPGAGWCITSVFFMLMIWPKLSQAIENLPTLFCMLALVVAFSAQSSANRNSLTISVFILVFAWCLLMLKTEPSVRHRMLILLSEPLNASNSITENIMLKKEVARTHPCLTPFVTGKATELSPLSFNLACMPSWNCLMMVMNFSELSYFAMILHRRLCWPCQIPWSDQHKSTRSQCPVPDTSLAANTMSTVPRFLWKSHWLSGKSPCSRWFLMKFRKTLARVLLEIKSKEIPKWLSHACWFPSFCKYGWWRRPWSFEAVVLYPYQLSEGQKFTRQRWSTLLIDFRKNWVRSGSFVAG